MKKQIYMCFFTIVLCTVNLFAGFNFSNQSATCLVSNSSKFKASNAISGWDGTLERESSGTIAGEDITFVAGIFTDAGSSVEVTGDYDPNVSNNIILTGNISGIAIRYDADFEIPRSKVACFDINEPLNGQINLNTAGVLELNNDLHFSEKVTFASSGIITGNGNAIVLHGDLTIPQDCVISFSNDTIINGQGNEIILERWAQLFVDTNVTLTLKNVKIRNTRNSPGFPPIRLAAHGSKLALDNVNICPLQDFYFLEGQMFIYNDVTFTGSKQFVYRSSQPSRIFSQGTWYFEPNTTFYYDTTSTYSPSSSLSTFNAAHLRNNELIIMEDETSAFYLNQCTFQTSHSGLRLTKGQLFFDNRVQLKNDTTTTFSWLSNLGDGAKADQGEELWSISWSPCGRYLAVGGDEELGNDAVSIYSWDGSSLTSLATADQGSITASVAWSRDGRYLAVGGTAEGTKEVSVYEWSGSNLTQLATEDHGSEVWSISWSLDGRYLSVGGNGSPQVDLYEWNGSNLIQVSTIAQGSIAYSLSWSPCGRYLVVGSDTHATKEVYVYEWNGSNFTQLATEAQGNSARSVAWSPDGRYLAVGGTSESSRGSTEVTVHAWDGSSLTPLATEDQGTYALSVAWSTDGRYLAVGGVSEAGKEVYIYEWDGSNLTSLTAADHGAYAQSVSWSPCGNYLAVGGVNFDKDMIVYKVNYQTHTYAPSYDTSLIFGDSTNGAAYDLDIFLLAGAKVDIYGAVLYDNV